MKVVSYQFFFRFSDYNILIDSLNILLAAISVSQRDNDYIVRSWESHSGYMLWENRIKNVKVEKNSNSIIEDDAPKIEVVFAANNLGVLVLLEGSTLINLNVTDGSKLWRSDLADRYINLHVFYFFHFRLF